MTRGSDRAGQSGFTLIEALVAIALLSVGLSSLVQLTSIAAASARSAVSLTTASRLAQGKMEEMRAGAWPEEQVLVCCEYLDARGQSLATGGDPPIGAAYVRRWSIDQLTLDPANARVLHVGVAPVRGAAEVSVVTVRARRPQ
jgi:prepilin-type N-terminal cleavage/methylation domain-containing protein